MRQLVTAAYQSRYQRDFHGDMFPVVQDCIRNGKHVPVDVNLISSPEHPHLLEGTLEEVFPLSRIDVLIEMLNDIYRKQTDGQLHFQLRDFASYHEENFPEYIPLDSIAIDEHSPDGFTVRIVPFYAPHDQQRELISDRIRRYAMGVYHAHGLIDIRTDSPLQRISRAVNPLRKNHVEKVNLEQRRYALLLAHEIGHGIFGYGHCGDRKKDAMNCIMRPDYLHQSDQFCEEDRRILEKLVS